jgi:hypothetical protein
MAITVAAVATLLAPYFLKAGETLAVESVKLALEKREDIKNSFLNLFKQEEFISLGLSENQKPEEVKALLEAETPAAETVRQKIESNRALIDELAKVLSQQEGRKIETTNYFENVNTINIDQRRS